MHTKYAFNGLILDPGNAKILRGGQEIRLRRQSFDVLAFLVQRQGQLVTKDELHREIWGEAVVTNDSMTHCIIDIRKAIGDVNKDLIQTVPRRGYVVRMPVEVIEPGEQIDERLLAHAAANSTPRSGGNLSWFGGVLSATFIGLLIWSFIDTEHNEDTHRTASNTFVDETAVRGVINVEAVENLSAKLADSDVNSLATSSFSIALNRYGVTSIDATNARNRLQPAELTLRATLLESGENQTLDVLLLDAESNATLWSARMEQNSPDVISLFERAAARAAYAIDCGLFRRDLIDRQIEPALFGMWIRACDLNVAQERLEFYEQALEIVATAPQDAASHATLAIALARLDGMDRGASNRQDIRAEIQSAAATALDIDPEFSEALIAMSFVLPGDAWQDKEALLLRALQGDTRYRWARSQYATFLYRVGRLEEAARFARRTTAIARGPNHLAQEAWLLAVTGNLADAAIVFDEAEQQWPADDIAPWKRFLAHAFFGDAGVAGQLLVKDRVSSIILSTGSRVCWRNLIEARTNPNHGDAPGLFSNCRTDKEYIIPRAFGALEKVEDAINAIEFIGPQQTLSADRDFSQFLFNPEMRSVRRDVRFMGIAEKLGLATYWRDSGKLPDFCSDPELQYDCENAITSTTEMQIARR